MTVSRCIGKSHIHEIPDKRNKNTVLMLFKCQNYFDFDFEGLVHDPFNNF